WEKRSMTGPIKCQSWTIAGFFRLCGFRCGRASGQRIFHGGSDCRSTDHSLRHGLSPHLYDHVFRNVLSDYFRKTAAIYRKNNLHYVDPDAGSDHQYHYGSYYDLWPVWISQNGGGRSRPGYSSGTDYCKHCSTCSKQKEKPGASSYLPGIPRFKTDHPEH